MPLGLYGKLPARGDFVVRGVPAEVLGTWERWLSEITAGARAALGPDWGTVWDSAPAMRFWIGARLPGAIRAGAMRPSRDAVGRRYPLSIVWHGDDAPPLPLLPAPQVADWYASLSARVSALAVFGSEADPDSALEGLSAPPESAPAQPGGRADFFAEGEAGIDALMADVMAHDHALAAAGRSYWWTEAAPGGGATLMAVEGLPDASNFAALLRTLAPPVAAATAWVDVSPAAGGRGGDAGTVQPTDESRVIPADSDTPDNFGAGDESPFGPAATSATPPGPPSAPGGRRY